MPREKILFKQTYRKHAAFVKKECLPITRHTNTYQPREMEIVAAGRIQMQNGELREFQDVRLYFPAE